MYRDERGPVLRLLSCRLRWQLVMTNEPHSRRVLVVARREATKQSFCSIHIHHIAPGLYFPLATVNSFIVSHKQVMRISVQAVVGNFNALFF